MHEEASAPRARTGQPPAAKIAQASVPRLAQTGTVLSTDDRRRIRFWRPDTSAVTGMLRVEHEDRTKITYAEHYTVVVVYQGAFDGWYRGHTRTHAAGSLKLKEPGEVHRDLCVHAPFTLQGAGLAPELVAAAADAMGLRFRQRSAPAGRARRGRRPGRRLLRREPAPSALSAHRRRHAGRVRKELRR